MTKHPDLWTQEDLEKIFAAMEVLQSYGLDTSSTTMNLTHVMPHIDDPISDKEPQ